mmetsp:Transcript_10062/g.17982  ORF Transcript_10062/g.17982 Transcript_10062/m.17982 type:complete len:242 (-) Transcript_10062:14-739(-)
MAQVRHDGNMALALLAYAAEELDALVSVLVSGETLRPEGERAGADAKVADVREELRVGEGLQVLLERVRAHDHRVAAGHEHVRDLLVLVEILEEACGLLLCEAQLVVANELRPAEAVGAVGVASLGGGREHEGSFRVLVLDAGQLVLLRRVESLLASRVRVELFADFGYRVNQLHGVATLLGRNKLLAIFGREHLESRHDERVHRVFAEVVGLPVDELFNEVRRSLEWEDECRKLDVLQVL